MKNKLKVFLQIFLPIIIGSIVGFIINDYIDYNTLNKPPLSPPSWLFPVMWSIIYLLLGISYYLFRKNNENKTTSIIYYTQLIVNYLWSIIFFILKWRFFSIIWIILLDILVMLLLYQFFKKEKASVYLNIPYLIWSLFATYLTTGIYLLN